MYCWNLSKEVPILKRDAIIENHCYFQQSPAFWQRTLSWSIWVDAHTRISPAISHWLLKCTVATIISHWLKVQSRWFKNYIFTIKCILASFCIFLNCLHTLLLCHILLFECWIIFLNSIRVSNNLDPDQARRFNLSGLISVQTDYKVISRQQIPC